MPHAIFHRTLIGANFIAACSMQSSAPRLHPPDDFGIFYRGFAICSLLCSDEIGK